MVVLQGTVVDNYYMENNYSVRCVFVYREKFLLTQLATGINHQYNYVSTEVGMANTSIHNTHEVMDNNMYWFSREVW